MRYCAMCEVMKSTILEHDSFGHKLLKAKYKALKAKYEAMKSTMGKELSGSSNG